MVAAGTPATRFTRTPDGAFVAYQALGDGPDLLLIPGWATHIEAMWEEPHLADFLARVATFARLLTFDKRGVGLSDPMPGPVLPTLDAWTDDVQSVLDVVRSERVVLCAAAEAGPMAMLFAATHPERVSGLVLVNTFATLLRAPDYPAGISGRVRARIAARFDDAADGPVLLDVQAPSLAHDDAFRRWATRYQRLTAGPGALAAMADMILRLDVRAALATIAAPTRVVHASGNRYVRPAHGRYLAGAIPAARYVEVPGADHLFWLGAADLVIGELVTGSRWTPDHDRVLATILFTDIVDSTARAIGAGDRAWTARLGAHDAMVRRQLERFRGLEVNTTGDGFVAIFDGPARAIHCACAIRDGGRQLGLDMRAGVHTGEIEQRGEDIAGIAVHIAARVQAAASPAQVLVSETVPPLVTGAGIDFRDVGERALKGVDRPWRLLEVV